MDRPAHPLPAPALQGVYSVCKVQLVLHALAYWAPVSAADGCGGNLQAINKEKVPAAQSNRTLFQIRQNLKNRHAKERDIPRLSLLRQCTMPTCSKMLQSGMNFKCAYIVHSMQIFYMRTFVMS